MAITCTAAVTITRKGYGMWKKTVGNKITFLLHSPDGDQGYPGALDMHVTYLLDDENTLNIHYEAVPDKGYGH